MGVESLVMTTHWDYVFSAITTTTDTYNIVGDFSYGTPTYVEKANYSKDTHSQVDE